MTVIENGGRLVFLADVTPGQMELALDGWVQIFTEQGYELTTNREVEPAVEKIAIYVDLVELTPGHVAKSDGRTWKSKLGRFQDISHTSLDLLEGDQSGEYGIVSAILRRPIITHRKKAKQQ